MSDSIDYMQAGPATVLVHAGRHRNKEHRFVNPPIVKGSTVLHESVKDMIEREEHRNQLIEDVPTYGIWGTETHQAFYENARGRRGRLGVCIGIGEHDNAAFCVCACWVSCAFHGHNLWPHA